MSDENKLNAQEKVDRLKEEIAELGFIVEETEDGEIRVSEKEN